MRYWSHEVLRHGRVSSGNGLLDHDGAAGRFQRAIEDRKKAVADVLDDVAVVLGDGGLDDIPANRFKLAWVPSSSCSIRRLKPAMSALMIAARRRAPSSLRWMTLLA